MFNQFWDIGITPNDRLCDCLLYVMTQIPKEELGKITNCIEKANPKLGNILTYLMEEKEDDGYFMKEVSEFLCAAHEEVKMSLCNNLIDICYNLGVEDKGRDLLGLGLWLEIYSDIQSRSKSQRCLDLDQFSVGAVITALHVWLDELSKAFELDEELPHVLGICWRRKPSNEDLACVFESYLMELNSPFYKDTDTNGWFYTTIQEAMSWLQSGGSDETVADLNSTVLDVPINLSSIPNPIPQPLDSLQHIQLEYPDGKSSPNENQIYEIMKGFGDNVTEHDAGFILNNMSKLDDAMLVFKYHMKKVEPGKQVILYNAMLKLLKECGEFEKAEKLFDEMLQLKVKPDIITFSTMISYAGLCAEHRKAVKWFEMMPSFKCKPDDNLLSIMISSNASIDNVDMASRLYHWAKKKKWKVDEVACSALIKIYGKSGNYDGCLRVYSDMKVFGVKPNMATYKELLCAMGRGKRASEAKAIHDEMINNGISPNQSTYEAVLQAYCRGMYKVDALIVYKEMKKRASEAKAIYEEMINNGISPNQSTYEAVLQAYCRAMYKLEALIVYKEMKEKGMDIGRDLYHMLLDLCADVGYADEAVEIFQDMKSSGTCHPDSVTYASLIKVYSHTGNVSEAEAMLKEMMNCGLEPNLLVLTSLAGCYGRAKQTDDVVRIFDQLLDLGLRPDDRVSACLVHVMAQIPKQEHGRILDCIEKAKPKLGFVIRYLMEERDDDRIFFKEASELFNSIDDFVIKKSMCRSLIDLCVNLEVPNRARDLFNLGLTLELYTNMQNRSQTMWSLHVKNLTIGTTLTALQVWMDDLSNALESGEELPPVLGIYTKKYDKSKLRVIESYLKEHNAPFQLFPKNNNNGFLATTELAKSWLQSRVLDVPAIVVES
jgi:pentatricopeptide repeat protein